MYRQGKRKLTRDLDIENLIELIKGYRCMQKVLFNRDQLLYLQFQRKDVLVTDSESEDQNVDGVKEIANLLSQEGIAKPEQRSQQMDRFRSELSSKQNLRLDSKDYRLLQGIMTKKCFMNQEHEEMQARNFRKVKRQQLFSWQREIREPTRKGTEARRSQRRSSKSKRTRIETVSEDQIKQSQDDALSQSNSAFVQTSINQDTSNLNLDTNEPLPIKKSNKVNNKKPQTKQNLLTMTQAGVLQQDIIRQENNFLKDFDIDANRLDLREIRPQKQHKLFLKQSEDVSEERTSSENEKSPSPTCDKLTRPRMYC